MASHPEKIKKEFDLVVIGTGAAGAAAAYACREKGWEVAVIDSNPFGGTCALRGCDPKKVLIGGAELIDWQRRFAELGIVRGEESLDWRALMRFKKTFTDPVPEQSEKSFQEAGIATFHGRARFLNKETLEVDSKPLTASHFLVAAGARPQTLEISGEEHLITSTQFLDLEELPARIIFVGGGYISFEFAHMAARAGAKVRILHRGQRPLEGFDADLVQMLLELSRKVGIEVVLGAWVSAIEKLSTSFGVHIGVNGKEQRFESELVVHGAGRVPDLDDMNLEAAEVKRERRGVIVNEHLQSVSNPAVYAAGDAAASSGLPLTPVAGLEGYVAAQNMLKGNNLKPNYEGVPTVVFTVPPLAAVGLGEKAAREQGLKFRVNYQNTSSWYSSRRINIKHSGFKVLVEEGTERILGAHLFGPHAEEVINIFALAIRKGLAAGELKEMSYAYPTSASDIAYMLT